MTTVRAEKEEVEFTTAYKNMKIAKAFLLLAAKAVRLIRYQNGDANRLMVPREVSELGRGKSKGIGRKPRAGGLHLSYLIHLEDKRLTAG